MTPPHPLLPFTPTAADPDELERRTVGRSDVLDHLLDGARAATRGLDRAHTLLVAPRGGGKTHVLTLFVHRLRTDEQFARALAVVVVAEDAVEIASHLDLLVAIVEALGTSARVDSAHRVRRDRERAELERLVLEILDGRSLVLVVENLDRVFADLGSDGQRQLRAFVETSRAVMLVASTPALFHGVRHRTEPWFGSFAVERLVPWSVEEGTTFLERVARERGDDALANLIASPIGHARLTAAEGLVGGLPRLWTILAGCITVELLDDLVPLVLATLEELVPYYQARLNELAPGERKLVVALCRAETLGSRSGRTVRELALAAGVPETSAPKLLRRLEEASWVVATKPAGTDRRATWYEIREPLLRYHVAYRRQAGEPLALIVSFLRAWFSPSERRRHLADAAAGSVAESYVMESLRDAPAASDALYRAADPVDLLTGAREWFSGKAGARAGVRSRTAAIVAESVALVALGRTNLVEATLAARLERVGARHRDIVRRTARAAVDAARTRTTSSSSNAPLGARQAIIQAGLDAGIRPATEGAREDEVAVALIAHGWRGASGDDQGAYEGLTALLERADDLGEASVALRLAVEAELAYLGCMLGIRPGELQRMQRVRRQRERVLGPEHPDALTSRSSLAYQTAAAGDHRGARDLFAALVRDRERVLGPEHSNTLTSRAIMPTRPARRATRQVPATSTPQLSATASASWDPITPTRSPAATTMRTGAVRPAITPTPAPSLPRSSATVSASWDRTTPTRSPAATAMLARRVRPEITPKPGTCSPCSSATASASWASTNAAPERAASRRWRSLPPSGRPRGRALAARSREPSSHVLRSAADARRPLHRASRASSR